MTFTLTHRCDTCEEGAKGQKTLHGSLDELRWNWRSTKSFVRAYRVEKSERKETLPLADDSIYPLRPLLITQPRFGWELRTAQSGSKDHWSRPSRAVVELEQSWCIAKDQEHKESRTTQSSATQLLCRSCSVFVLPECAMIQWSRNSHMIGQTNLTLSLYSTRNDDDRGDTSIWPKEKSERVVENEQSDA